MRDGLSLKRRDGFWYVYCGLEQVSIGYSEKSEAVFKRRAIAKIIGTDTGVAR